MKMQSLVSINDYCLLTVSGKKQLTASLHFCRHFVVNKWPRIVASPPPCPHPFD